ncbi:YpdA family putative bacillithiol disulfide reductase [soil metagenome]
MSEVRLDTAIVGAGPCGIAAGVAASRAGLRTALFERGAVVHSIYRYPTYTTFFSGAEKLEVGGVPFTIADDKPTRREALRYYRRVVEFFDLDVRQYHDVLEIGGSRGDFVLRVRDGTGREGEICAAAVIIATGYFDSPNRLEVPGADLPKTVHYFREPFPYYAQDVLVVGGGNSAADAALTCWREGARVTMAHLFAELDPGIKPWVRPDLENRLAEGSIPMLWEHEVVEIRPGEVELRDLRSGEMVVLPNDWVLSMTGYTPDYSLLRSAGVHVDAETGVPEHDAATFETNVPGIYVAGVLVAGYDANRIFIENGKFHGQRIVANLGGAGAASESPSRRL